MRQRFEIRVLAEKLYAGKSSNFAVKMPIVFGIWDNSLGAFYCYKNRIASALASNPHQYLNLVALRTALNEGIAAEIDRAASYLFNRSGDRFNCPKDQT